MCRIPEPRAQGNDAAENRIDLREALNNDGPIGAALTIQIPAERITRLLGLMYDLDPKLLIPDNPVFPPADDPNRFYENIKPVLERHPLARNATIRASGIGLHVIVRFEPSVELRSAADQQKWSTLVRAAQCSLPADHCAPGITSLTRAVGSINPKNNAVVEVLRLGEPIEPQEVAAFVLRLLKAPFRTVATILLRDERVQPCPICRVVGTRLDVLDNAGKCYAHCGDVTLAMLFDCVLKPFAPARKTDEREAAEPAAPRRRAKAGPAKNKCSRK